MTRRRRRRRRSLLRMVVIILERRPTFLRSFLSMNPLLSQLGDEVLLYVLENLWEREADRNQSVYIQWQHSSVLTCCCSLGLFWRESLKRLAWWWRFLTSESIWFSSMSISKLPRFSSPMTGMSFSFFFLFFFFASASSTPPLPVFPSSICCCCCTSSCLSKVSMRTE